MHDAFVIQCHRTREGEHFDVLFELADALLTFQCPRPPHELAEGQSLRAPRLPDHRRIYLTYEGPVRGDRGEVHIVDRGHYRRECFSEDRYLFDIMAERTTGRFEFVRQPDGAYLVTRLPGGVPP